MQSGPCRSIYTSRLPRSLVVLSNRLFETESNKYTIQSVNITTNISFSGAAGYHGGQPRTINLHYA